MNDLAGEDLLRVGLFEDEAVGDRMLARCIGAARCRACEAFAFFRLCLCQGLGFTRDALGFEHMFLTHGAQTFHPGQHHFALLRCQFEDGCLANELVAQTIGEHQFQSAEPISTFHGIGHGLQLGLVRSVTRINERDDVVRLRVGEEGERRSLHVHTIHAQVLLRSQIRASGRSSARIA